MMDLPTRVIARVRGDKREQVIVIAVGTNL
jgi:hypothetical protein